MLLHGLLIAAAFFLSTWKAPRPPEPREPVVPVTFEQIAEFRVDPPSPAPEQHATPAPKAAARAPQAPAAQALSPPVSTPPPQPPPPKQVERAGDPSAPQRRDPGSSPKSTESPGGAPGAPGGFDVQRALRDFGRNLRATEPGAGQDGGGAGKGSGRGSGDGRGLNVPDLTSLPSSGFGFGNLEFESKDFDWKDYARQIYVAIWRAWHNRLYLTTDAFEKWSFQNQLSLLDHQNRIRFRIERNGEVSGIALETPSGCVPLDDSALDALSEVVLPPLPSEFQRDQETIHARFLATGEIRNMRPSLQYLRDRGYF